MRQKRLFMVVLAVVLCVGFMVSIFSSGKAHAQVVRLKVSTYFPAPASQSTLLEEFCRELERRTGGRVKVDFFAGGSLVSPVATFDGIVSGITDIGYSHVYYTSGRMPVTEAIGLPLGYPSAWVSGQVINDFYDQFKPKEFERVRVLWMNTSPPSAIATSKKAVRKLEDLRGLTIRAPGMAGIVIRALGGTPAPTPMPEVYDAISKGVLDGEASNFETLRTFRFAEVVKHTTSVWQITNPFPFYLAMNKDSYAKLPADIKVIFDSLVGEYKEQYILMWNSIDFAGRDYGREKGVEFIELPPDEVARWKAAVEPVIDGYIKTMVGKGHSEAEVKGWIKFIRDRIDFWTKKQVALRIPSPAGPPELKPRL
ncbi:MAG: TRAP transporter substrate-binding protein [Syntrophaceae bacterium]|nr:TRAP transporter substrate-binding protein [Syntrophaceae bacterium]